MVSQGNIHINKEMRYILEILNLRLYYFKSLSTSFTNNFHHATFDSIKLF